MHKKTTLLANQKAFEEMSTQDIARGQLSAMENIERDIGFMAATARSRAVNMAKSAAEAAGLTGEDAQKFVKETADGFSKGTIQMTDNLNKVVSNYIGELKGEKPKTQGTATTETSAMKVAEAEKKAAEAKQTATNTSSTNRFEYVFKANEQLVDGWARQIIKDSSLKDDFINTGNDEYTVPPKN